MCLSREIGPPNGGECGRFGGQNGRREVISATYPFPRPSRAISTTQNHTIPSGRTRRPGDLPGPARPVMAWVGPASSSGVTRNWAASRRLATPTCTGSWWRRHIAIGSGRGRRGLGIIGLAAGVFHRFWPQTEGPVGRRLAALGRWEPAVSAFSWRALERLRARQARRGTRRRLPRLPGNRTGAGGNWRCGSASSPWRRCRPRAQALTASRPRIRLSSLAAPVPRPRQPLRGACGGRALGWARPKRPQRSRG